MTTGSAARDVKKSVEIGGGSAGGYWRRRALALPPLSPPRCGKRLTSSGLLFMHDQFVGVIEIVQQPRIFGVTQRTVLELRHERPVRLIDDVARRLSRRCMVSYGFAVEGGNTSLQ